VLHPLSVGYRDGGGARSGGTTKNISAEADLRGAELRDADLGVSEEMKKPTDLSGVKLSGTNLQGADLTDANVTEEQLAICKSLEGATMPDGSKHD
jgi:serine/threonine protein kinase, bacterial